MHSKSTVAQKKKTQGSFPRWKLDKVKTVACLSRSLLTYKNIFGSIWKLEAKKATQNSDFLISLYYVSLKIKK